MAISIMGFSSLFNWNRLGGGRENGPADPERRRDRVLYVYGGGIRPVCDRCGYVYDCRLSRHGPERHLCVGNESTRLSLRVGQLVRSGGRDDRAGCLSLIFLMSHLLPCFINIALDKQAHGFRGLNTDEWELAEQKGGIADHAKRGGLLLGCLDPLSQLTGL